LYRRRVYFGNKKKSAGTKSGEWGGWGDDRRLVLRQKFTGKSDLNNIKMDLVEVGWMAWLRIATSGELL
jgi:hypothetical protein